MPAEVANPLLVGWLKECMDVAHERNSKGYQVYKKAYNSMKASPLEFQHPSEAIVLSGLGEKLCKRLTDKLQAHCEENGLPMPSKRKKNKRPSAIADIDDVPDERSPKKPRKHKPYVPKLRSGAYALLVVLGNLDRDRGEALSKTDLIELAEPHCDSSFTVPTDTTKYFTAWKSMDTLLTKELVCTKGHPTKRYYLSDEGWDVASAIRDVGEGARDGPAKKKSKKPPTSEPPNNAGPFKAKASSAASASLTDVQVLDLCSSPEPEARDASFAVSTPRPAAKLPCGRTLGTTYDTIILPPGSFDVKLVVDNREVRSVNDRDYISEQLKKRGIDSIKDKLELGDFLWIAKVKPEFAGSLQKANIDDEDQGNTDIVLDYIVERKRKDDFINSITDGRFHEQKFRLAKSAITCPVYLIEEFSVSGERMEKFGEAMETAIKQLQVVYDVFVKTTQKLDDSVKYLAQMTKLLQEKYKNQEIHVLRSSRLDGGNHVKLLTDLRSRSPETTYGLTLSGLKATSAKNDSMTLRDMYLKMLLCIRGVSAEKAIEISKIWKTPNALIEAYERQPDTEARKVMISDKLSNAIPRKKIAKTLSTKIAEVWAG